MRFYHRTKQSTSRFFFIFFYNAQGKPGMVTYNDVDYFYVYNLQGDVVALIDANGTQEVEYGYDAWGNPISKSGSMVATLGTENLFRYREYVYDEETMLYYNKECGIDGEKSLNEVKGELK